MVDLDRFGVGLDLGTTEVRAVILEGRGEWRVIGVGRVPCRGLRGGVVIDVGQTVAAIRGAVDRAQTAAGVVVGAAVVGLGGVHIGGVDSAGVVPVHDRGREIEGADRRRAVDAARTVAIPYDREVVHVLPQAYAVDGHGDLRDPVGMVGVRLEARVHVLTGAVTTVQNVCRCVERAGLQVADLVVAPLAAARAVLSEEERELGVDVIDLGSGTTGVAAVRQGTLRCTAILGFGGHSVTRDIAICLGISQARAAQLKHEHGSARPRAPGAPVATPPGPGSGRASRTGRFELGAIIRARLEEIFRLVGNRLAAHDGLGAPGAGVVLTGGGACLDGAAELAEAVLGCPVRSAAPSGLSGLAEAVTDPVWATAVGLAQLGSDAQTGGGADPDNAGRRRRPSGMASGGGVVGVPGALGRAALGAAGRPAATCGWRRDHGVAARMKDWCSNLL